MAFRQAFGIRALAYIRRLMVDCWHHVPITEPSVQFGSVARRKSDLWLWYLFPTICKMTFSSYRLQSPEFKTPESCDLASLLPQDRRMGKDSRAYASSNSAILSRTAWLNHCWRTSTCRYQEQITTPDGCVSTLSLSLLLDRIAAHLAFTLREA